MNLKHLIRQSRSLGIVNHVRQAFMDLPDWDVFYDLFKIANSGHGFAHRSFGTLGIDQSQTLTESFDKIIETVNDAHPGNVASVLSIIHFLSANDNKIPDSIQPFFEEFINTNPEQVPPNFEQYMIPTRHADPIDGVFIQCNGLTRWRVYYNDDVEAMFVAEPGDVVIIPKGIEHSVESLCPRSAISIGMTD